MADALSRIPAPSQFCLLFCATRASTRTRGTKRKAAQLLLPSSSTAVDEPPNQDHAWVLPHSTAFEALTSIEEQLKQGYASDPWFKEESGNRPLLVEQRGLWWYKSRPTAVVVPDDRQLKDRILREAHDAPYSGHLGVNKTTKAITPHFWWPKMREDIVEYIRGCDPCQRNKAVTRAPAGLLQPVPKPEVPWEQVGVDFITGLPVTTNGFDAILVVIDHCTKMVHFAPTTKECTALEFAKLFVSNVFRYHGLPSKIVSDRGPQFVNEFIRELLNMIGTRQSLSTAFHPASGGQHERVNRVLEEMLRHYISADQADWDEHLPVAEFAINNAVSRSTGLSPFVANQGWEPRTPLVEGIHRSRVPLAVQFVKDWQSRMHLAKEANKRAQDRQKALADAKRRELTFQVDDEVLLSTKNLKLKVGAMGTKKLLPQWVGPFKVCRVVSPVAYEIVLPPEITVHPVFHVSLLKPYKKNGTVQPPPPALLLTDDGEQIYTVDAILDHRDTKLRGNRISRKYLVAWKGYGPDRNSWEREENISASCHEALDRYWRRVPPIRNDPA